MNRVEGRAPDAAMTERQFVSYLESIKSGPDAPRIRQLVLEHVNLPPLLQINFGANCLRCAQSDQVHGTALTEKTNEW